MKKYPPVMLVDTWLYLVNSRKPELEHVKLPLRRAIKHHFGAIEFAQLYVEQLKDDGLGVYFI
jgi:hypothetical protein